jgi:hypothetical protein
MKQPRGEVVFAKGKFALNHWYEDKIHFEVLRGGQLPKYAPNIRIVPRTRLLGETVRRIRGSVETTLTSIARFHRLSRAALRPGNEIDADDWVVRFRDRPFPTQKLGRWFGQPDYRVGHVNK